MDSPKPAAWPWLVLGLLGTGALVVSVFVLLDPAIGSGSVASNTTGYASVSG